MKKGALIFFLCFFISSLCRDRETLAVWLRDVAREDEYPKSENNNPYDPNYLEFYKEKDPNFLGLVLVRLGFAEPLWNPFDLAPQLKRVTQLCNKKGIIRPFFEDIVVEKGSTIILFGSLHGALHSVTRDLAELRKMGLLDDRLVLTKPSTHLVFLGDVLNGTPYSLFLIELVLTLMEKNPGHVWYLRGKQETNGQWRHYFALRTQLKRWAHFWGQNKQLPLEKELNDFFDVLPDGIILHQKNNRQECLVIGDKAYKIKPGKNIDIHAYLVGERPYKSLKEIYGLDFRGFVKGTATWSLISSPTFEYQKYLNFADDTFALLSVPGNIRDSLISVFYQNAVKKDGFKKEVYVASLGLEVKNDTEFKEYPTLLIASTIALTGGVAATGQNINLGLESAMMWVNALGGVKGTYLKPVVFDDQYDPRKVLKALKRLKQWFNITTLVAPEGSPPLMAYLDRVKAGEFEVFFPITGGPQFRDPENHHIVHFRPSYKDEAPDLVDHVLRRSNARKFVLIYQNDAFGLPLVEAAHKALEKHGIKEWVDIPFLREQANFDDVVKKLLQADPEAIGLFFSSSTLARNFLISAGVPFFVNKHIFSTAFLEDEGFRLFLKNTGIAITFSFILPDPWGSPLKLIEEYRTAMKERQIPLSSNSLEGFFAGRLYAKVLEEIGPPYTGRRAREFMETMENYSFEGFTLTFDPMIRGFRLPIWIRGADGSWTKYE